jgi:hypothetical protein
MSLITNTVQSVSHVASVNQWIWTSLVKFFTHQSLHLVNADKICYYVQVTIQGAARSLKSPCRLYPKLVKRET